MVTGVDPEVVQKQYAAPAFLRIMQETHDQFTFPQVDFAGWVLERCQLRGNERILDIGAGPGRYYEAIRSRFPDIDYTALDNSPGMLTNHTGAYKVIAGAEALPFPTASFDVVMANHMLYHVPNVNVALVEMRRVVKQDGIVVAATNSATSMPQFVELLRRGILLMSKPGTPMTPLQPPQINFSLENGAQQMAQHFFAVVRHDLPGTLVFPEPAPAMRYLETWRAMREPLLPLGVKWEDVMLVIRDQINRIIKHFGDLSVEKLSGVLIASNHGGFIREYRETADHPTRN
ncbi:MAG: methyltransferase domain-containing protein [Chloroflexi bacterium]|nr:methyltransferase domain-containing protein [Chloroflexota bacterium]